MGADQRIDKRKIKRIERKILREKNLCLKLSNCHYDNLAKFIKHYFGTKVMSKLSKAGFKEIVQITKENGHGFSLQAMQTLAVTKRAMLDNIKERLI